MLKSYKFTGHEYMRLNIQWYEYEELGSLPFKLIYSLL